MNEEEHIKVLELKLEKMKLEVKIKKLEKEIEQLKCEIRRLKCEKETVIPWPFPYYEPCPSSPYIITVSADSDYEVKGEKHYIG